MFFNGTAFIITSARKIRFGTVKHITNWTAVHLSKILNKVIKSYGRGGFIIRVIMMEIEFNKEADTLVNVEVRIKV